MSSVEAVVPRLRALPPWTSPLVRGLLADVLALLGSCILPPSTGLTSEGSTAPGLTAPASSRVAPYGGKSRPDREKHLLISYDRGVPRGDANGSTLTMDVTGSSGVLRLKRYGKGCSGTDRKVVCRVGGAYDSWTDWAGALPRAAPTSRPGDTGELHISFRDAEGDVSRATTRIEVGGPVLALREQGPLRMSAGKGRAAALGVRNTGELPADGFTVTATVDDELGPVRRSRSCDYLSHSGATIVTRRFPGVRLEPGEEAHVANWLVLGGSRSLMYASFRATVELLGSGADNGGLDGTSRSTSEPSPSGTPRTGTGPALAPQVRKAPGESSVLDFEVRKGEGMGSGEATAALKPGDTEKDHADPDATNNPRTFDLFGPVPDEAGSGPKTSVGVVVVSVVVGCVVLVGAGVLVRRRLRLRRR